MPLLLAKFGSLELISSAHFLPLVRLNNARNKAFIIVFIIMCKRGTKDEMNEEG